MKEKIKNVYKKEESYNRKGKVIHMKHISKHFVMVVFAFTLLVGAMVVGNATKADAATRKGYTITTANTRVYSNPGLTSGYGWIYPTDEVTVITVTSRYSKVSYPISRGRTKTGYISTGAILTATGGTTYTSRGRFTTYRRDNTGNVYGYVATNDKVMVLGTRGSFTQVKYPVSGGYKYAFAKTSDVNTYLKPEVTPEVTPEVAQDVNPNTNQNSYDSKVSSFINTAKWKNGASWGYLKRPTIGGGSGIGCYAYANDFIKYVYGKSGSFEGTGTAFYSPSGIRSGDVIKVTNSQHWFVVLYRNGNKLTTAEGNWGGKVVVSSSAYSVSGNTLYRNGKKFRTFSVGYHYQ
jgi:hypothetical protein